MTQEQLNKILETHKAWLNNEEGVERADLRDADLSTVKFRGADLRYAYLTGANLRYADFRDADLREADLSGVDLTSADLSNANLMNANLSDANLTSVDLTCANLINANLTNANLTHAHLTGANLHNADSSSAGIVVMYLPIWAVYVYETHLKIGCQYYTHDEWLSFEDSRISKMHSKALGWWKEHKPLIIAGIETVKAQVEKKKLAVA